MRHLADWRPLPAEFRRVPAPGGRVPISTYHPLTGGGLTDGDHQHAVESGGPRYPGAVRLSA
ncbi:hypothetical protein [Streptomyces sp. NPDC001388]|uniref:hypothetical protein n=1 Tax=Streptomyces sp. NPDC001388 TaxID=3364568 RepID=UPI0036BCA864